MSWTPHGGDADHRRPGTCRLIERNFFSWLIPTYFVIFFCFSANLTTQALLCWELHRNSKKWSEVIPERARPTFSRIRGADCMNLAAPFGSIDSKEGHNLIGTMPRLSWCLNFHPHDWCHRLDNLFSYILIGNFFGPAKNRFGLFRTALFSMEAPKNTE